MNLTSELKAFIRQSIPIEHDLDPEDCNGEPEWMEWDELIVLEDKIRIHWRPCTEYWELCRDFDGNHWQLQSEWHGEWGWWSVPIKPESLWDEGLWKYPLEGTQQVQVSGMKLFIFISEARLEEIDNMWR